MTGTIEGGDEQTRLEEHAGIDPHGLSETGQAAQDARRWSAGSPTYARRTAGTCSPGRGRAHVRRGEGGIMTAQAPCAKIARQDPDLADRMWATITVGGREVVDAEKRALGRRVCETCPLRTTCIADSLVGGWKDRNLIGGLDYRRRTVLSKLVCRDLGITARQLHDMPAQRVSDWLERHPDWADRTRLADSSDWRQRKRLQRRKRERLSVAPSFTDATPVPPAIQGVLF